MRLAAIILAGGRSTRMGRPKVSLPFGDETLLQRVCRTLARATTTLVVVRRDAAQELGQLPTAAAVTEDLEPGAGPLGGIAAGLRWLRDVAGYAADDAAFVTACDHPFLQDRAVHALADRIAGFDLVMPNVGEILQPMGAVYRLRVLDAIERLLRAGMRTPRSLASATNAKIVTATELATFDPGLGLVRGINTPEEYAAALAELGLPPESTA